MATIPTSKQLGEAIANLEVGNGDPSGILHYWAMVTAYYTAKMYEENRKPKWVGGPR